jgi:glycosyltransferase involved in cell wall biosynthesis
MSQDSPPIVATANTLAWVCTNWTRYLKQGCPEFGLKTLLEYTTAQEYPLHQIPAKLSMEVTGKAISRHADLFTVQTSGMKEILTKCKYNQENITVVPNLLDERFDLVSPEPKREVVFAGRLIERKGVMDILDAFITVEPTLPADWELKILGDGPLKDDLAKRAQYRDTVSIDYCPYEQLPEVYRTASVLVHGSKYPEPFSRTWLEAMASETAIVASENPSSRAVLSDCAALYDPFDQESLRSSLQTVLTNEAKRKRMQEKGKDQIDQFRPGVVIEEYIQQYSQLMDSS